MSFRCVLSFLRTEKKKKKTQRNKNTKNTIKNVIIRRILTTFRGVRSLENTFHTYPQFSRDYLLKKVLGKKKGIKGDQNITGNIPK